MVLFTYFLKPGRSGHQTMKKNNRPLDRAAHPHHLIETMHRWKYSALAAAAIASGGLYAADASALTLGSITVQSALGEPLRAEIDLPQITPAETESLRATTAPAPVFRAQGMEYSPIANQVRIQLHRLPDGRTVLRLSSNSPVNDPFVDYVVDARWSTGHITRSYTMLFDPPALRRAPATVTAAPQISEPTASQAPRATPSSPSRAAAPRMAAAPRPAASPPTNEALTVQRGETAGRIAAAHRPASVSLDQMLVALVRANPQAFIQGNVNRLKAGAVLQLPSQDQALATPQGEARQIMAVQSRDFNAFRRTLARSAPATEQAPAERSATGAVQTHTDDQSTTATAPDKLTLSKGALQGKKATEELLAQRKQGHEASARVEELSKNIEELNKLSAASSALPGTPTAPTATAAASGPAVTNPGITLPAEPTAEAATAAAPTPATDSTASAEAAAPPTATPAPVPTPPPGPSFLQGLLDEPMLPLAGGSLLALLLGYGAYRVLQRRRNGAPIDSSFMDSHAQPDSFFGASGGQRVDTAGSATTMGSSFMAYSPSQLDAGGDVDPVAEAEAYLAYGRDLQAEEILKEAVRHNPTRIAIHTTLGEIYAKRQDRKSLEAVATDVYKLSHGEGTDWARITELGRELDPVNPLYQPGGHPAPASVSASGAAMEAAAQSDVNSTQTAATAPAPLSTTDQNIDLDLDLDFDLPEDALTDAPSPAPVSFAAAAAAAAATAATAGAATATLDSPFAVSEAPAPTDDLELPEPASLPPEQQATPAWAAPATPAPDAATAPALSLPSLADFDFPMDLPPLDVAPAPASEQVETATAEEPFVLPESGLMEFNLDELSLDLDTPETSSPTSAPADAALPDDPLATKLALAQEFNTIGDSDGARTLIEEVIAESSGELKARAQRLLSELD